MKVRDIDIIKEEFIDELVLWELNNILEDADDPVVERALHVVIAAHLFQALQQHVRMHRRPVGQHDDMLAVIGDRIGTGGIDDDRAVMAFLFLQA